MKRHRKMILRLLSCVVAFGVGGLTASGLVVWKIDGLHRVVSEYKDEAERREETEIMNEETVDLSSYDPLQDVEGAWYTQYHFIAHAGGAVDGKYYTNSKEAWEKSYAKGNRVFDADLNFTSDGVLVLRHSWSDCLEQNGENILSAYQFVDMNGHTQYTVSEKTMDYDEFINEKIYFKYTPMAASDMVDFMLGHEDVYIAVDYKGDAETVYGNLSRIIAEKDAEEVLDRIIVNFYSEEDYEKIMSVYPFINVTARQHYVEPQNYYELAAFCMEHGIHVVNVSQCYIGDDGVQLLRSCGIHVYVAVVDFISALKEYHETYGVDGAVTNYLYEDDWTYIE